MSKQPLTDEQLIANYIAKGGTILVQKAAESVYEPHPNPEKCPTNKVVHTGPKHAFNSIHSLDETMHNYGR